MDLFEKALHFAADKHSGQRRKGSPLPYILHPIEVATIVASMSDDRELLAAALLHDTLEDTDTTEAELRETFGDRVTALVLTETEDKRRDLPAEDTWQIRKEESFVILRESTDPAVKMLWLGDKLSNMRSFYRQHLAEGDAMWNRYHQHDPRKHEWYYRTIADYVAELAPHAAYREYLALTDLVFSHEEAAK